MSALIALGVVVLAGSVSAQDKKDAGSLELKLVAKEKSYVLDTAGMTKAEYKKKLEKIAEDQKGKPDGFGDRLPDAPKVELVLSIVNTGKEDVTVYAGGDPNVVTFMLKGPGVVALNAGGAFTADFRGSKGILVQAGKSYDIPLRSLSDGFRGASRS